MTLSDERVAAPSRCASPAWERSSSRTCAALAGTVYYALNPARRRGAEIDGLEVQLAP